MWVGFQIAFSNGFPDKWLESKWICMEEVSKYLFQKLPKGAYLWGILEHCSWHQLQRARDSENWHKNGNQPLAWIFKGWKCCEVEAMSPKAEGTFQHGTAGYASLERKKKKSPWSGKKWRDAISLKLSDFFELIFQFFKSRIKPYHYFS